MKDFIKDCILFQGEREEVLIGMLFYIFIGFMILSFIDTTLKLM